MGEKKELPSKRKGEKDRVCESESEERKYEFSCDALNQEQLLEVERWRADILVVEGEQNDHSEGEEVVEATVDGCEPLESFDESKDEPLTDEQEQTESDKAPGGKSVQTSSADYSHDSLSSAEPSRK